MAVLVPIAIFIWIYMRNSISRYYRSKEGEEIRKLQETKCRLATIEQQRCRAKSIFSTNTTSTYCSDSFSHYDQSHANDHLQRSVSPSITSLAAANSCHLPMLYETRQSSC